jgi:hypothetical protein
MERANWSKLLALACSAVPGPARSDDLDRLGRLSEGESRRGGPNAAFPSTSAAHSSAFHDGVQTTFIYSDPSPRTRSVRAIIACAFNAHMIGLSAVAPRTTSSTAVFDWQSECDSAVEADQNKNGVTRQSLCPCICAARDRGPDHGTGFASALCCELSLQKRPHAREAQSSV